MKKSVFFYTQGEAELATMKDVCAISSVACSLRGRSLDDAVTDAASWRIIPDLILVDIDGVNDPLARFEELAKEGPDAEVVVLAIGSCNDVDFARKLRARGVHDYIAKPLRHDVVSEVLLSGLKQSAGGQRKRGNGKITVITGARHGVGVSTVAALIADHHSRAGKNTIVLDLDVNHGIQYLVAFGDQTAGLRDVIQVPERIDGVLLADMVRRGNAPWAYLSTNSMGDHVRLDKVAAHALAHFLSYTYDHVVIDLPHNPDVVRALATVANEIILVTAPTIIGLRDAKEFFETVQIKRHTVLVVNDAHDFTGSAFALPLANFSERVPCSVFPIGFATDDLASFMTSGGSADISGTRMDKEVSSVLETLADYDRDLTATPKVKRGFLARLLGR